MPKEVIMQFYRSWKWLSRVASIVRHAYKEEQYNSDGGYIITSFVLSSSCHHPSVKNNYYLSWKYTKSLVDQYSFNLLTSPIGAYCFLRGGPDNHIDWSQASDPAQTSRRQFAVNPWVVPCGQTERPTMYIAIWFCLVPFLISHLIRL